MSSFVVFEKAEYYVMYEAGLVISLIRYLPSVYYFDTNSEKKF